MFDVPRIDNDKNFKSSLTSILQFLLFLKNHINRTLTYSNDKGELCRKRVYVSLYLPLCCASPFVCTAGFYFRQQKPRGITHRNKSPRKSRCVNRSGDSIRNCLAARVTWGTPQCNVKPSERKLDKSEPREIIVFPSRRKPRVIHCFTIFRSRSRGATSSLLRDFALPRVAFTILRYPGLSPEEIRRDASSERTMIGDSPNFALSSAHPIFRN